MSRRVLINDQNPYPAEFVARVKAAFPTNPRLHRLLDLNSGEVKQYLEGHSDYIPVSVVVLEQALTDPASGEELLAKVRLHRERAQLYREWGEIYFG